MLVIAPRNYHLDIINYYRKDNPFFDIKVVDKSDLIKGIGYSYKNDIIIYLMSQYLFSYDESETYLSFLKTDFSPTNSKLEKLKSLQDELIKAGYLFKSEIYKNLFLNKSAKVIGYSKEDIELKHMSNLLDMKLEFFEFGNVFKVNDYFLFSRLEDEVYFVLNEIAHDIDLGRDINDIYIFNRNEEYLYYLKTFAPLFGYHINFQNNYSFNKTGVYSEFKKLYESNHDIDESLIELEKICLNDDIYHQFVEAVNKIRIDNLPYEIESVYLNKKLSQSYVEEPHYLKAINLISNPTLLKDKKVYVLGFSQGMYPLSKKDDSYLNEDELFSLHLLSNKLETRFDHDSLLDFFKLDNDFVISFSNKSLQSSTIYHSPLVEELVLKKIENPFKEYFYSLDTLRYIACNLEDLHSIYDESSRKYVTIKDLVKDAYCSYDNSYQLTNVYHKDSHLRLSTSQLTDYASCPFKYYLGRILNVDPFEESIASIFGNIVHKLLQEALLDDDYDINKHYDSLVESSNVSEEIKILWSLSLKEQVINMVRYVRLHNRYMTNPEFFLEEDINIDLNQYTSLTGRIDKLVVLDKKYLVMIDYKTGSSGKFEETYLKDGLSSQLPTYALLAKNSRYSKYTVSGLYISPVFTNDREIELKDDELVPKYLKLTGKSLDDYQAFFAFDSTIASGKSSFVASISCKEEVLLSKGASISKEKLDEYIEIVKNKYIEVSELIRANKFDIYPLDKGKSNSRVCQYCTYRDICYLREKQVHYLSNEENDE